MSIFGMPFRPPEPGHECSVCQGYPEGWKDDLRLCHRHREQLREELDRRNEQIPYLEVDALPERQHDEIGTVVVDGSRCEVCAVANDGIGLAALIERVRENPEIDLLVCRDHQRAIYEASLERGKPGRWYRVRPQEDPS